MSHHFLIRGSGCASVIRYSVRSGISNRAEVSHRGAFAKFARSSPDRGVVSMLFALLRRNVFQARCITFQFSDRGPATEVILRVCFISSRFGFVVRGSFISTRRRFRTSLSFDSVDDLVGSNCHGFTPLRSHAEIRGGSCDSFPHVKRARKKNPPPSPCLTAFPNQTLNKKFPILTIPPQQKKPTTLVGKATLL